MASALRFRARPRIGQRRAHLVGEGYSHQPGLQRHDVGTPGRSMNRP
ncbi:hypothetical protein [Streptomyces sp. NPDC056682]